MMYEQCDYEQPHLCPCTDEPMVVSVVEMKKIACVRSHSSRQSERVKFSDKTTPLSLASTTVLSNSYSSALSTHVLLAIHSAHNRLTYTLQLTQKCTKRLCTYEQIVLSGQRQQACVHGRWIFQTVLYYQRRSRQKALNAQTRFGEV